MQNKYKPLINQKYLTLVTFIDENFTSSMLPYRKLKKELMDELIKLSIDYTSNVVKYGEVFYHIPKLYEFVLKHNKFTLDPHLMFYKYEHNKYKNNLKKLSFEKWEYGSLKFKQKLRNSSI